MQYQCTKNEIPDMKRQKTKILTSEKQRPLRKYIWNWNETLWKESSQNVCKNHEIFSKNVLERAWKSTQNALSIYKNRNTRHLRTIIPKVSQVKSKDHYEYIWNWNETLWKEASQNVCKNHAICTENVLKGPSNRLKMHCQCTKKRNTRRLRTIIPNFSQVKAKTIMKVYHELKWDLVKKSQSKCVQKPPNLY